MGSTDLAPPTLAALCLILSCSVAARADQPADAPETRAVAFLAREVPQWAATNHCYSCHNNGDAARALVMAAKLGLLADRKPLADTLDFLAVPANWDDNGPEGPFKDKKLARIQFAAALAEATAAGIARDRASLVRAAELVAELQQVDGGWETDAAGTIGSPATYGQPLATAMAARVLAAADAGRYAAAIERAHKWFHAHPPQNVMHAAAALLALANDSSDGAQSVRATALKLIAGGQSADGGWGPFVTAPAESFDTALVLLALQAQPRLSAEQTAMLARGRKYLVASQEADGSWPATTRPPGVDSYAQRLSTSGWATQALLVTRPAAR